MHQGAEESLIAAADLAGNDRRPQHAFGVVVASAAGGQKPVSMLNWMTKGTMGGRWV